MTILEIEEHEDDDDDEGAHTSVDYGASSFGLSHLITEATEQITHSAGCYEDIQSGQELWGRQHLTDNDEAITGRREEEEPRPGRRRWDGRRGKKRPTRRNKIHHDGRIRSPL